MNAPGDHLLAGAELALEEDRSVVLGDFINDLQNLFHFRAFADHATGVDGNGGRLELLGGCGGTCIRLLQAQFNGALQICEFERFGEVVECAQSHCFNCGFDGAVTGHHDDLGRGIVFFAVANNVEAVHISDEEVDDHEIRLDGVESFDAVFSCLHSRDVVTLLAAGFGHQVQDGGFVVDDEYFGHGEAVLSDAVTEIE